MYVEFGYKTLLMKLLKMLLLGFKELGFYVFRTLMCIVGKP